MATMFDNKGALSGNSFGFGNTFTNPLSNQVSPLANYNSTGIISQAPNQDGGISSLGGVGYQAYMVPGGISVPKQKKQQTTTAPAQGALASSTSSFTPPKNETQAPAPISEAKGEKVDNRSFLQKMNDSSKDQWANFTGTGKYDTSNGQKAPANAMSWQDKMNAGFGLAASVMSAFDRR